MKMTFRHRKAVIRKSWIMVLQELKVSTLSLIQILSWCSKICWGLRVREDGRYGLRVGL